MITTPTSQPKVRLPKDFQPLTLPAMSRQAAGFIINQETKA